MKTAFFHDARLIKSNDGKFYSIGFTYDVWQRYIEVFDQLIVSTRMQVEKPNNSSLTKYMKPSSGSRVKFKPISEYKYSIDLIINRKKISDQISKVLEECDCAIIRLPSFIGSIACIEAKKMKKPYLIEVVGCARDSLWNHSLSGKLTTLPSYLAMKRNVKEAPYVVYVTNKFLQHRYPTNGKNINCSDVALTKFVDNILVARLEKISEMDKRSKIIIGTTGAVNVRYKGQQYVIKALGKLKKQGITNYEYQLVGGGDTSYLKTIAEKYNVINQVKFLGTKPHDEVISWLDSIDIYIQPSLTEGLPRALIEAMSRGIPAIGSDAGGIPELLDDKYIVKNISKNIDKISEMLESTNQKTLETQAKRNFVESKIYDRETIKKRRYDFLVEFRAYVEDSKHYK